MQHNVKLESDKNKDLSGSYAIRPNKTQIKKDIAKVNKLAEELTQLTTIQLQETEIPKSIRQAIEEAKLMSPIKSARKRQLKFITALLRNIELTNIIEHLGRLKIKNTQSIKIHYKIEQWQDKLITNEGNSVLTELLHQYPTAKKQHLRQLQRNAQKEAKSTTYSKHSRILYKYLQELLAI